MGKTPKVVTPEALKALKDAAVLKRVEGKAAAERRRRKEKKPVNWKSRVREIPGFPHKVHVSDWREVLQGLFPRGVPYSVKTACSSMVINARRCRRHIREEGTACIPCSEKDKQLAEKDEEIALLRAEIEPTRNKLAQLELWRENARLAMGSCAALHAQEINANYVAPWRQNMESYLEDVGEAYKGTSTAATYRSYLGLWVNFLLEKARPPTSLLLKVHLDARFLGGKAESYNRVGKQIAYFTNRYVEKSGEIRLISKIFKKDKGAQMPTEDLVRLKDACRKRSMLHTTDDRWLAICVLTHTGCRPTEAAYIVQEGGIVINDDQLYTESTYKAHCPEVVTKTSMAYVWYLPNSHNSIWKHIMQKTLHLQY